MLFDLNVAVDRLAERTYDFCVCGTGPAGITVARKLSQHGQSVLLLEGGGLEYSAQSQDEYAGRSIGHTYWLVESGRLRYFGGSSNHWGGRCGILDPIDFEQRKYLELPGWPISREQLLGPLDEALEILDIAGKRLEPREIPQFRSPLFVRSGFALSPPTRFASKYGPEVRRSGNIDMFYNANVTDIAVDDPGRVTLLKVKNYVGGTIDAKARTYILAMGALETARILLASNNRISTGVGNHSGMVGRCFMEHLNVSLGRFVVSNPTLFSDDLPLAATETLMRQHDISNGILDFTPNAAPQSYGRLKVFKEFLRETGCAVPSLTDAARKVIDFDCPGDGIVTTLIEQTPNASSRITLSDERDALGLPRIRVDWQLSRQDQKTIRVMAMEAAKEMARLDCARVQLAPSVLNSAGSLEIDGHAHQMGTTRMSADPRYGVVDPNCRVHGFDNLYLIGSSVFPTGGGTNPTLTIVLLALRLADFLKAHTPKP